MAQQQQQEMALKVAQKVEKQIDETMKKLDNLDEKDIEQIRKNRVKELKAKQDMMQEWRRKGHGQYEEVADQKQWFEEVKQNRRVVCHFYRPTTWRCEIVDKHLEKIAKKHMETRFIKVDAEKCPFLAEKLSIVLLPTIIMTKESFSEDRIEGFDELGGTDKFTTEMLEKRLAKKEIIDIPEGFGQRPSNKKEYANKNNRSGRAIYAGKHTLSTFDLSDDELDSDPDFN